MLSPHGLTVGLLGAGAGLLVGLSGVGGGSLTTPALILGLGVSPLIAIGTDLLFVIPTKIVGAIVHARQGSTDWRVTFALAAGGIPGAFVGIGLLDLARRTLPVDTIALFARHAIGVALFASAAALIAAPILRRRRNDAAAPRRPPIRSLVAIGFAVGALVSLTSIGSGSITLPLLAITAPRMDLRKLIGTDIVVAAAVAPAAAFGHWALGDVDMGLFATLVAGAIPGVIVGSRLCARLPEMAVRRVLAGALVLAASKLI
ncbi:MAG: sulfite exporter TauE/SafE family protein [Vulcanimicrobiaceae bacterium]